MKTVLLVDNDRISRAVVVVTLAPHPEYQLLLASSYLEALWTLCEHEVDLVIAHMGMPEREGFELLTYMANYRPRVPVLTLSHAKGDGPAGDVPCWRGHLSKPLQPHALMTRIRDCLRAVELGEHRPLALHDLLRILAHERENCILRVKAGLRSGEFEFSRGKIAHVSCGSAEAEAAARQMLSWESAWFRVEPVPSRLSMPLQGQFLASGPMA